VRTIALLVLTASGCASADDLRPQHPADAVALDTEHVCSRRDAAAYGQVPVTTPLWADLAMRADRRPTDAAALRTIADLMRANLERFTDSSCQLEWIENLERSAAAADDR
jgi:hypothetical protein